MKSIKFIILFLVLIGPGIFFLLLRTGTNNFKTLPTYGPKELDSVLVDGKYHVDTVYHTVSDFELINFDSSKVNRNMLAGKTYVADFFFATCPEICPKMTAQLKRVQEAFKAKEDVFILSHTVNPEYDTPEVLSEYVRSSDLKTDKWYVATGDKKEIYDLARYAYFLPVADGDGGDHDFIHSSNLILVDRNGRIRGIYEGTDAKDVDRLIDEIKVLLADYEKPRKKKK